jgi:hypothetical protein
MVKLRQIPSDRISGRMASPLTPAILRLSIIERPIVYRLAAIGVVALAALVQSMFGFAPVGQNMMDLFTFLDGAHRIRMGQIPHVDFISSLGAGTYFLHLTSLTFAAPGFSVFWANLLFLVLMLPVLLQLPEFLGVRRAAFVFALTAIAILAPINIDFGAHCELNFNTGYNRWGAAILICAFVLMHSQRRVKYEAISWLILLTYAFLIKINFFAVVLGAIIIKIIIAPRFRICGLGAIAFFVSLLLSVELLSGSVSGYARDVSMAARVNQESIVPMLIGTIRKFRLTFALLVVFSGVVAYYGVKALISVNASGRLSLAGALAVLRVPLSLAYMVFGTIFAESQNLGGIGFYPLLVLAALAPLRPGWMSLPLPTALRIAVAAAVTAPFLYCAGYATACYGAHIFIRKLYTGIGDIAPLFPEFSAHKRVIAEQYDLERLEASRGLRDWVLHRDPRLYIFYLREVSDAVNVLRKEFGDSPPPMRTLDFADPFPALLKAPPAPGGYIALHYLRTISTKSYVPAERYFDGIRLVLVPNCYLFELNPELVALYAPYLDKNFQPRRITNCWSAYVR